MNTATTTAGIRSINNTTGIAIATALEPEPSVSLSVPPSAIKTKKQTNNSKQRSSYIVTTRTVLNNNNNNNNNIIIIIIIINNNK